jgi:hypothetical protein
MTSVDAGHGVTLDELINEDGPYADLADQYLVNRLRAGEWFSEWERRRDVRL